MFELKNATMIYDMDKEEKVYAMRNINISFPDKGLVGIIGPSGSGKSTMMYTMSTLKNLTSGEILYNGKSITGIKDGRDSLSEETSSDSYSRDIIWCRISPQWKMRYSQPTVPRRKRWKGRRRYSSISD